VSALRAGSVFGKTERRLALVILLTSVIPLVVTWALANSLFTQASALWFNEDLGGELDRGVRRAEESVALHEESLRHLGLAIAREPELAAGARDASARSVDTSMQTALDRHPQLVELELRSGDGELLARRARAAAEGQPLYPFTDEHILPSSDDAAQRLRLTFALDPRALDERVTARPIVQRYHRIESARIELYHGYLRAFALLLVCTALATTILGVVLARGVTKRIGRLGAALRLVAAGDLSITVPVTGTDELTDLAASFNQMIAEVAESRARVEFLQRMGAWQEMAKRLAHEIKNPLTPIQLAVEECQRRYDGSDARFGGLLDTTVEIVREEVGSLRHLVEHFANFARLPAPMLEATDLAAFVKDVTSERSIGHDGEHAVREWPEVELVLPERPVHVTLDRQLFRRVLVNLLDNAAEARAPGRVGRVRVTVRPLGAQAELAVEDDGPGIEKDWVERVFDPYVTTKATGTGLGLAIVKKVVVEHEGTIAVQRSRLGGARFVIRIPRSRITLA